MKFQVKVNYNQISKRMVLRVRRDIAQDIYLHYCINFKIYLN